MNSNSTWLLVGGKPVAPSKNFLVKADLNGDGQIDWAIDEAEFNCDGAASMFSGSGGSQIYVFAGKGGNEAHWTRFGATQVIMDNLYADKKVVPMIVVMPNAAVPGKG